MTRTKANTMAAVLATAGLLTAGAALAVDGVIEINAASAAAGGITPGDGAGFPVTLSEPGSYRLTSNLEISSTSVNGIEITTSFVTLDLNGFTISGPGSGSGQGITSVSSLRREVTVRNGTVEDMGNGGVRLPGAASRVENMRANSNGDDGLQLGFSGVAKDCVATNNGDIGIIVSEQGSLINNTSRGNGFASGTGGGMSVGEGGFVSGNTSMENTGEGLVSNRASVIVNNVFVENSQDGVRALQGCLVKDNTVRDNGLFGLNLGDDCGYAGNVITINSSGSVTGLGIQIGTNICGTNTVCP